MTEACVDESILRELLELGYDGEILYSPMRTTQGSVMGWLRDKHRWHVCPEYKAFDEGGRLHAKIYCKWCCEIKSVLPPSEWKWGVRHSSVDSDEFYYKGYNACWDSYEGAVDECIRFALNELLTDKGNGYVTTRKEVV